MKLSMNEATALNCQAMTLEQDILLCEKCGYDIESRESNRRLRFIEVKGRNSSANEVTVTKNEILTALNAPENFILAIVTVDGNAAHVVYIKEPFTRPPDFSAVSVNYKISSVIRQGKVLIDRNISCEGDLYD